MSDIPEQDTGTSKQAARPIFWILGIVAIFLTGFVVYGII